MSGNFHRTLASILTAHVSRALEALLKRQRVDPAAAPLNIETL